jgi:cytochrome c-type protein NapC
MQWVAKESVHGANRTGVRATCHDCHIPGEYPELLWYKGADARGDTGLDGL